VDLVGHLQAVDLGIVASEAVAHLFSLVVVVWVAATSLSGRASTPFVLEVPISTPSKSSLIWLLQTAHS
jgi:hypothetical protein